MSVLFLLIVDTILVWFVVLVCVVCLTFAGLICFTYG